MINCNDCRLIDYMTGDYRIKMEFLLFKLIEEGYRADVSL